jgi:signal transduction histidine kinase
VNGQRNVDLPLDYATGHEFRAMAATAVAREVHDIMGNNISLALRYLDLHEIRHGAGGTEFADTRAVLTGVLTDIRRLSAGLRLRPAVVSLPVALSDFVTVMAPAGLDVQVSLTGEESLLPDRHSEELFLVIREGLRNVFAHSGARNARVTIRVEAAALHVLLTDDGIGYDETDGRTPCSGIAGMRERVTLLHGSLHICSRPGHGTRTEIVVPLHGGGDGV